MKVNQLSLLSVATHTSKYEGGANLSPKAANERVRDYNKQIYERRKIINAKAEVKRKLKAEAEA